MGNFVSPAIVTVGRSFERKTFPPAKEYLMTHLSSKAHSKYNCYWLTVDIDIMVCMFDIVNVICILYALKEQNCHYNRQK